MSINDQGDRPLVRVNTAQRTPDPDTVFTDEEFINVLDSSLAELAPSMAVFRNSSDIKNLLLDLIDRSMMDVLGCCSSKQNVKIRLDVILKLLSSLLCFPLLSVFMGIGASGSDAQLLSIKNAVKHSLVYFRKAEFELYAAESDEAVDDLRALLAVTLLEGRRSSIVPIDITLEEHYAQVVQSLACHLLCVRALADDIQEAISANLKALKKRIVDPQLLGPLPWQRCVVDACAHFFRWLRSHQSELARSCRNAEIVQSVDSSVRAWLRAEEYASSADIIRIFQQKYKQDLTGVRAPWQSFCAADVDQARKDLQRESVLLNMRQVSGHEAAAAISAEIAKVVVYHFDLSTDVQRSKESGLARRYSGDSVLGTDTLELLESNVLIAASRTLSSGDAFFIVEDLFGGEGLHLRPVAQVPPQGIKISVSAAGISVTTVQHFHLLQADGIGESSSHPLVRFKCTIKTALRLGRAMRGDHSFDQQLTPRSVRSFLNYSSGLAAAQALAQGEPVRPLSPGLPPGFALYSTLLSDPEKLCQKAITIEPYL